MSFLDRPVFRHNFSITSPHAVAFLGFFVILFLTGTYFSLCCLTPFFRHVPIIRVHAMASVFPAMSVMSCALVIPFLMECTLLNRRKYTVDWAIFMALLSGTVLIGMFHTFMFNIISHLFAYRLEDIEETQRGMIYVLRLNGV